MKVLVVAATNKEVYPLRNKLEFVHQIEKNFSSYKYEDLSVDILVTGIGSVFTTYYLTKILSLLSYDIAFNIGITGSFDHFLEIGYVVNVVEDQFSDLGVEDNDAFYTLIEKEMLDGEQYPFTNGVLQNETPFTFNEIDKLISVKGITVNTVHGKKQSIEMVQDKFKPEVESMEGAAFFYVCMSENIPFYQIRSISNYVEIRNIENWNVSLAIDNLTKVMINIFSEIHDL
ncbi:MAG: futalosine hydrolase [Bacteroidota bacterium]